ncbi:MAG: urea ABC transporter ATP-binding protein UrtD [Candidatus Anammoxibacter sp.]
MHDKTVLYLENVTVSFDGFLALKDLNFVMDYGELRVVIGPNGAGKSTMLDVICGMTRPVKGRVIFGKEELNITKMSEHGIVNHGIGRKFQTPSLFTNLTVHENFELSLRKKRGVFSTLFAKMTTEDDDTIHSILKMVELVEKTHERAGSLSHGEKQWVELGMVLAQDPQVLLLDEPVAGMSIEETNETAKIINKIAEGLDNKSIIVIDHDMDFVEKIARKVTVLHNGTLLCEGTFKEIQNDERVINEYLGREQTKGDEKQT